MHWLDVEKMLVVSLWRRVIQVLRNSKSKTLAKSNQKLPTQSGYWRFLRFDSHFYVELPWRSIIICRATWLQSVHKNNFCKAIWYKSPICRNPIKSLKKSFILNEKSENTSSMQHVWRYSFPNVSEQQLLTLVKLKVLPAKWCWLVI